MSAACTAPRGKIEFIDEAKTPVRICVGNDEDAHRIESVLKALGYAVTRDHDGEPLDPARGLQKRVDRLALGFRLNTREMEVFRRVVLGDSVSTIARELRVSTATIYWRLHNVLVKTGAANREQLLRLVLFDQLTTPPAKDPS